MSFSASISGHVNPGENVDQAAVEQVIADKLADAIQTVDDAYPGVVTGASFGGQFVTVSLLPAPVPPPGPDPALVAIASDLREQADALDALVAAGQPGALTSDAETLRTVANDLDPAATPEPEPEPAPEPAPEPEGPFVEHVAGEQYSDYLERLTAWNTDPAHAPVSPLSLEEWSGPDLPPV